ncbi:putative receptor-like protein kinase At4g00960 [Oryza brachyantha]|uniref:putative receptor-like protein kinase At4g00960 n=1 Tax=Oryza brachyantha TaxID=4533 RepID=UPI001ADA127E|nr:putative receptor-like protein kinase At4g00960 [Oryza brachyantha]
MASDPVSTAANIAQLTGVGALGLITLIVEAAKTARRNKRTCLELAKLVEQVGDLLRALQEQPGVTFMERPETSAPLVELQETLRQAYELVESCRRGSYRRRFCAGKDQSDRLRHVQSRISIYLQLFPIICHIDGTRLLVRVIADGAAASRSPRSEMDEDEVLMSLTNRPSPQARFQKFSYSQLVHATNDFSLGEQLEKGTLAILYKGKLHGNDVTIKRPSVSASGQRLPECMSESELFTNEIKILPELQHKNIVKLVGFCTERSERATVYECVEKGSLENIFFGPEKERSILDWPTRFRIIEGIAQGLAYLHNYSRVRIIHRDLKPSNILLDSDMNPKISNFELAEMLSSDTEEQRTDNVVGSIGFSAPEYMHKGIFSVKTDVYSFGVVVLEILSGKRWTQPNQTRFHRDLLTWAWARPSCCVTRAAARLRELVDPALHGVSFRGRALPRCLSFPARRRALSQQREMRRCARAALLCIQERPKHRPAMPEVLHMLRPRKKAAPPLPGRSRFTTASSLHGGAAANSS